MNKVMVVALAAGLTGMLASCGGTVTVSLDFPIPVSTVTAVNNDVQVYGLRSEYIDQNNNFVACDNVLNGSTSTSQTAVATYFQLAGNVSSVSVGLRGDTTSAYDGNYNQTFNRDQISTSGGNGSYRVTFYADANGSSGFLPQSLGTKVKAQAIVVTPTNTVTIKRVTTVATDRQGSFYATVSATNELGNFTDTSRAAGVKSINVYSSCTLSGTTNSTL